MKFSLEIGQVEKHRLDYSFNQLLGTLEIRVDGQPVLSFVRLLNEPVLEVFDFQVGRLECAAVRIEKQRKQLFGHRNRLYVDDRLTRVYDGM